MLDKYVYGSSTRQSPENPAAPVVKVFDTQKTVGGAGNVAINIAALGEQVNLFGSYATLGDLSEAVCNATESWNNLTVFNSPSSSKDIVKTRIYSNNAYIARVDEDYEVACSNDNLYSMLNDNLTANSIAILSDYGKGTVKTPQSLIERLTALNCKILVDPKGDLEKYRGATVLKPNLKEFCDWLGFYEVTDVNSLNAGLLEHSRKKLEVEYLIITVGAQGCIVVNEQTVSMYKPIDVKPVDVTGAGDTFIAALAVALHKENSMHKAVTFANKVASISVTKRGTSYVRPNEI